MVAVFLIQRPKRPEMEVDKQEQFWGKQSVNQKENIERYSVVKKCFEVGHVIYSDDSHVLMLLSISTEQQRPDLLLPFPAFMLHTHSTASSLRPLLADYFKST